MQNGYRIILADDHVLIRHGIKNMIQTQGEYKVVGEAEDGEQLLMVLRKVTSDLVIMDITMPKLGGIEVTQKIKQRYPRTKILILTMHKSKEHFSLAMSAGADGYLVKDDSDSELLKAIATVLEGETYLSPFFAEGFTEDVINAYRTEGGSLITKLSKREKEVLQLVVKGHTSKVIAERLNLSPRTVDTHRANLLKKFKLKKTVDLVNYAIRCGLVRSE